MAEPAATSSSKTNFLHQRSMNLGPDPEGRRVYNQLTANLLGAGVKPCK
jgi:hypothetical protein